MYSYIHNANCDLPTYPPTYYPLPHSPYLLMRKEEEEEGKKSAGTFFLPSFPECEI